MEGKKKRGAKVEEFEKTWLAKKSEWRKRREVVGSEGEVKRETEVEDMRY